MSASHKPIDLQALHPYDLGIIWAIGTFADGLFVIRHTDRHYIDRIAQYVDVTPYLQADKDKKYWKLKTSKITAPALLSMGWDSRIDNSRRMPKLDDYIPFARAYVELHGCFDLRNTKQGRRPRLRIYGAIPLLHGINTILSNECNVGAKNLQILYNNKTGALYYQAAQEITTIIQMMSCSDPVNDAFWADASNKIKKPEQQ